MSNNIRIRTTPNGGDKYLKIALEQDFDFIEILSLKISQEDTYRKFCSDYGVIVGRVVINNGFGVPNAKVSVFIPLDDVDKNDPLIKGLYPYEVIADKNSEGVRYNLLPKDGDSSNECSTPIGSFPNKREVLDNDIMLSVYCKYYKFTTTTNYAGDFMIFGVPLGTYTVHLDADISDIGSASQRPYDFISQGTPPKLFDSPTKFKGGNNLDKLIQIKTLNTGVNVQPFWGDIENCEIGITRLDFDLNTNIVPSAIFMGSIFGDQDKHSINKHCRPRKKLGEICEQITGAGSIDIIRKTTDGQIEEFSVEGGRLIDSDGTWAFQIPMNLNHMITDELGNLILSEDSKKGLATSASVRFKISMDETGGEGRLRTRAKYLVPNNPQNASEVDYSFGEDTKDISFRDLQWNKIYSVSNFIARFQKKRAMATAIPPVLNASKVRNMTALKDVDGCSGDKTPFPYNKVNTELNPIFFIICLIIKILSLMIFMQNFIIIPIINFLIRAINFVMNAIVSAINSIVNAINRILKAIGLDASLNSVNWDDIKYIPCVAVECPASEGVSYAPGCVTSSYGYAALPAAGKNVPAANAGLNSGLDDCIAFEMAEALNLFQFDFYNDWVNGTLFGFLLKYKKRKKHSEKFCEYECSDSSGNGSFTSIDGVDGNGNGIGDNRCQRNILMDTCYDNDSGGGDRNDYQKHYHEFSIPDGLIKKVGDEFFYASTTHAFNVKLFPTEIICLGSIFECDWQGVPSIQKYLIPTSYQIPPDVQEYDGSETYIETSGMLNTNNGDRDKGLFFSINCVGVHVNYRQCLNIRHICEIGVGLDEAIEDVTPPILPDGVIGSNEIDISGDKYIRDVFYSLNFPTIPNPPISLPLLPTNGFLTNFNLGNAGEYDFATATNNGFDYVNFRGYNGSDGYNFGQPKKSYYFYFGLLPGKTALDKMNERFFTNCKMVNKGGMIIKSLVTQIANPTGSILFNFIGGRGNINYTVDGVGPISFSTTGIATPTNSLVTLSGLLAGTYTITGVDTYGTRVSKTIVVYGLPPLYSIASVSKNATTSISSDGEITIYSVSGGIGPYTYELKNFAGTVFSFGTLTTPKTIVGLLADNAHGYILTITDSVGELFINNSLLISGPSVIGLSSINNNVNCFGGSDGVITLNITGAQAPIILSTTGPAGFTSNGQVMGNLKVGTYTTTVTDSLGKTQSLTNTLIELNGEMRIVAATLPILKRQCHITTTKVSFNITLGAVAGSIEVEYSIDDFPYSTTSMVYTNPSITMELNVTTAISSHIILRFKNTNGCVSNESRINKSSIILPTTPLQCNIVTTSFGSNYNHDITGVGGISPYSGEQLMTNHPSPTITATITDSVGCTATATG